MVNILFVDFRQGIITYPFLNETQQFLTRVGNSVNLLVSPSAPLTLTIAHGSSNYLVSLTVPKTAAWTVTDNEAYLYIDIDRSTAEIKYGYTTKAPVAQPKAPTSPSEGQVWFNAIASKMFEYKDNVWREVVRIFVAKASSSNFVSMSSNSSSNKFSGTQIGQFGQIAGQAGQIILDDGGYTIRRQNGELLTTVTSAVVSGNGAITVQLDGTVFPVIANASFNRHTVLRLNEDGTAIPANPSDINKTILLIAQSDAVVGQSVNASVEGIVTNPEWNWPVQGAPIWIDGSGQITINYPSNPIWGTDPIPSVGYVLTSNRILFSRTGNQTINIGEGGTGGGTVYTVNGKPPNAFGDVQVNIPNYTSELVNDDGFIKSVNGRMGNLSGEVEVDAGVVDFSLTADYPVNSVGWALQQLWDRVNDCCQPSTDPIVRITNAYFLQVAADPIVSIVRSYFVDSGVLPTVGITNAYFVTSGDISSFVLSPSSVIYPDTAIGTVNSYEFSITNDGDIELVDINATTTGDFAISAQGCTTLQPGAVCSMVVDFVPTVDAEVTGTLTVSANDVTRVAELSGKTPTTPIALKRLSTQGNQFVDTDGQAVRLSSVNWFGAEGSNYTPHGTWTRNWKSILDQIKGLGFNSIRLPFSGSFCTPGRTPPSTAIDWDLNPEFVGKTSIEIFDLIIEYCGEIGLYVVLDHHRREAGDGADGSPISGSYTATQWINNWKMMATRYGDNPTVVGADIHNEPHNLTWNDWASLCEQCGNAIHTVAPDWIIFVEGVGDYNGNFYWWGGQLQGVRARPVELTLPNRLAYSPHEYGQSVGGQSWLAYEGQTPPANWPTNLYAVWYSMWSYIHFENIAPIWIGEYGGQFGLDGNGNLVVPNRVQESTWLTTLMSHLNGELVPGDTPTTHKMSAAYWSFNPNSADTGGILQDDWITVQQPKMTLIAPIFEQPESQSNTFRVTDNGEYRITTDGKLRVL